MTQHPGLRTRTTQISFARIRSFRTQLEITRHYYFRYSTPSQNKFLHYIILLTKNKVEKNPARPTLGEDRAVELQLVATVPFYDSEREIDYAILKSQKVYAGIY